MLRYILGILKGFKYLRKTGDLIGDNLTLRLLRRTLVLDAPRLTNTPNFHKLHIVAFCLSMKFGKIGTGSLNCEF